MSEKDKCVIMVLILPFAVSSSWHYLEPWIAIPITVISTLIWVGSIIGVMNSTPPQVLRIQEDPPKAPHNQKDPHQTPAQAQADKQPQA